jgi:hypothetical protein
VVVFGYLLHTHLHLSFLHPRTLANSLVSSPALRTMATMEWRRRRGGAVAGGAVLWLLLLVLGASLCGGAAGLNTDGTLLMSFKAAVTADPLGAGGGTTPSSPATGTASSARATRNPMPWARR